MGKHVTIFREICLDKHILIITCIEQTFCRDIKWKLID